MLAAAHGGLRLSAALWAPAARRSGAAASAVAPVLIRSSLGLPSTFPAALACAGGVLGARAAHGGTPSWQKKKTARRKAAETRAILAYAATFDPMRTAKLQVAQTMEKLGWNFKTDEMISDGLYVDFTMADSYCAFELVPPEAIVEPSAPNASTTPASPPWPRNPKTGNVLAPTATPFPHAPAAWRDPVAGMVLTQETAARHALIRSKGWALVAVPFALWQHACDLPRQHYARRDLLLSMTLPQAPFESRPMSLGEADDDDEEAAGAQRRGLNKDKGKNAAAAAAAAGKGKAASAAAGGAGAEAPAEAAGPSVATESAGTGSSNREKRRSTLAAESRRVAAAGGREATADPEFAAANATAAADKGTGAAARRERAAAAAAARLAAQKAAAAAAATSKRSRAAGDLEEDKGEDSDAGIEVIGAADEPEEAADAAADAADAKKGGKGAAAKPKERRKEKNRGLGGRGR